LEEEHLHISLGTEEKVECHHAFGIFPVNHMCQQLHPKNIPTDINITHKLILTVSYSSHFCHTQQLKIYVKKKYFDVGKYNTSAICCC